MAIVDALVYDLGHHATCGTATPSAMCVSRRKIVQFSLIAPLCLCATMLFLEPRSSYRRLSAHITTHTTVPVVHHLTYVPTEPTKGWCQDYSNVPAQVLSKQLIIRRVFFDRRRRGGHSNSTVFLVEAKRLKLGSQNFAGCRVGLYTSNKFLFRPAVSYKFVQNQKDSSL